MTERHPTERSGESRTVVRGFWRRLRALRSKDRQCRLLRSRAAQSLFPSFPREFCPTRPWLVRVLPPAPDQGSPMGSGIHRKHADWPFPPRSCPSGLVSYYRRQTFRPMTAAAADTPFRGRQARSDATARPKFRQWTSKRSWQCSAEFMFPAVYSDSRK